MKPHGFTGVEILVALAVLGAAAWFVKPSLFPGASKRAQASTEATAKLDAATTAQGASAAASVAKIGEAAATTEASPAKDFILREVPVALARLPAPDANALIEAERRRAAIMEGRLAEARGLYEKAAGESAKLAKDLEAAKQARRDADLALETAAAAEHARTAQLAAAGLVALLLGGAWAYARFYSITPATLGKIAADVRAGENAIDAMDTHLAPWLHSKVQRASRLATPPKDA